MIFQKQTLGFSKIRMAVRRMRHLWFLIPFVAVSILSGFQACAGDVIFFYALDADLSKLRGDAVADTRESNGTVIQSFRVGAHRVVAARMGVGNIETALNAIQTLNFRPPDLVISEGPAGGLHEGVRPGSVFRIGRVVGYQRGTFGENGWSLAPEAGVDLMIQEAGLADDLPVCGLAAGDAFVASAAARDQIRSLTGADLVDMNSYGLMLACRRTRSPVVILKIVSDGAGEKAGEEFRSFIESYGGMLGEKARGVILGMPASPESPDAHENIRRLLEAE